ncbi:MAG: metallophosphoesterase family protein [Dehalococcoidia bacterium]|nr:metallophosphoesterase family protein [Dehalococcoidia bacterium]
MRLGLVSDVHCNIAGLQQALELMTPFDQLWCAGDSVFQFRWANAVVSLLRDLDARVVLGNHEETILGPDGTRALSSAGVDQDLVAWLRRQPYRLEDTVDGHRVVMIHGSPWEPWKEYHYPHEAIWARAASLDCDLLIVGHTHFKMAQRFGRVLVVNPGSAGDPRDHRNGFQLSCATWDTTTGDVTFYDYRDPTRNFASSSGEL